MATLRGAGGRQGRTPWGWILGLLLVGVATFAIIWWTRAGAPPVDATGLDEELRTAPAAEQPGTQPPVLDPGPPGIETPAVPATPPGPGGQVPPHAPAGQQPGTQPGGASLS
jgi:hypothetical protein